MSILPAVQNMTIARGTTEPFVWRFQSAPDPNNLTVLEPVPFTDVHLTFNKRSTLLFRKKLSEANGLSVTDALTGEVTWEPTPAETKNIPRGEAKSRYELEVWNGPKQTLWLMGDVTGIGGDNDD
jgi:hypothetical protein